MIKSNQDNSDKEEKEQIQKMMQDSPPEYIKLTQELSILGVWGCDGRIGTMKKRYSLHLTKLNITREQAIELGKKIQEVLES